MSIFFKKQTKGKTIRRDSKTQVSKTNKGNIILKTTSKKEKKLATKTFVRQDNREEIFPCF